MDQGATDDRFLDVTEVVTNCIEHGYDGQPGPFEIQIGTNGNSVIARARDVGMKHNVKLVAPQSIEARSLEITAMDTMFDFYPNVQSAVSSF